MMQTIHASSGRAVCVRSRRCAGSSAPMFKLMQCGIRPTIRRLAPLGADKGKVGLVTSVDEDSENLGGEYCTLDKSGKKATNRTVGEMEQASHWTHRRACGVIIALHFLVKPVYRRTTGVPRSIGVILLRQAVHPV